MKVTRDVIYDLLPGYFAGEATPDTRALVEEFLRDDPEFAEMMRRFRAVFQEQPHPEAASMREQQTFDRVREVLHKRSELRGTMVAFALAAFFVMFVMWASGKPVSMPLWAMTAVFAIVSAIAWIHLERLQRSHPELRRRPAKLHDV